MSEPLIRDIPSIKKTLEDAKNLKVMKNVMPFLRPVLKLLNKVDVAKIDEALSNLDLLEKMANEIAIVPDRFNDIFAERGWIIYERMSLEVAKAAVEKAEAGDIDRAEQDLVAYYNDDNVTFNLRTMIAVQAFRPRMRLAEKALIDYQEERYHACVLVVMALLDGMVNELHEQGLGFFTKQTSLEAWDSIAAHSKGLNALNRIFQKSRRKTVTNEITIPYRHGIMHGMDLGYDNRMVAAKCWAALFAAREWALKAEKGQLTAPPEEPKKTWRQLLQQLRENQRQKELLEAWRPRSIQIGEHAPTNCEPELYEEGTPERKLAEYLHYWKRRNYGFMAKCVPHDMGVHVNAMPRIVRDRFDTKRLQSSVVCKINDIAAAVTEIEAKLVVEHDGIEMKENVKFRLINLNAEGRSVIRGEPNGEWVIYNWTSV